MCYEIDYKFNEKNLIEEFQKYVDETYKGHYSKDKFQATEFIVDGGHGTGFCIGNVLKYAQRYGKKGKSKDARKDLLKVLHYALIQLHVHDKENKKEVPHFDSTEYSESSFFSTSFNSDPVNIDDKHWTLKDSSPDQISFNFEEDKYPTLPLILPGDRA